MKQMHAEVFARSDAITNVCIKSSAGGGWNVYLYGPGYAQLGGWESWVETARGGPRTWASLDTAYAWIQSLKIETPDLVIQVS